MSIATTTEKNSLATKYGQDGTWLSLHTADPGTTGASEVAGGTPPYARKQTTWGAASSGVISGSPVTFDVPGGVQPAYVGLWTAQTGGTFLDKVAVTAPNYTAQGTAVVTPSFTQS